jgi:hypothetical protein
MVMKVRKQSPSYTSYNGRLNRQRVDLGKLPRDLGKVILDSIGSYIFSHPIKSDTAFCNRLRKCAVAIKTRNWITERQFSDIHTTLNHKWAAEFERHIKSVASLKEIFIGLGD